ncbi:MAG TPA: hypothetical protein VI756_22070 [Blastocatellia bacterium]
MSRLPYNAVPGQLPYPHVSLRIKDNYKDLILGPFQCRVDSGSEATCVPAWIADNSGVHDYEEDVAYDFAGNPVDIWFVVVLDATVEVLDAQGAVAFQKSYIGMRFPILPDSEGLLGLDVLNDMVSTMDGPGLIFSI